MVFGDGILDSFREAYWIVAKTLLDLDADGLSLRSAIARMQKSFVMHQLLGQTQKPEGNSPVTFQNALNRLAEVGHVVLTRRGRGGKEQAIIPGRAFADLAQLELRLNESLSTDGPGRPAAVPRTAGPARYADPMAPAAPWPCPVDLVPGRIPPGRSNRAG